MAGCVPDRATLGIDEAGRGPILGPMVMAGVCVRTRAAASLTRRGIADSKAFSSGPDAHARRKALVPWIQELAESVVVRVVDVLEIDARVARGELNVLEREHATVIIEESAPSHRIICDGARMFRPLAQRFTHLVSRDRAESFHVAVAAASIVAKVRRDELFAAIAARYAEEFGPVAGGGYLNAGTHTFLRAYTRRYGRLPVEARLSWRYRVSAEPGPSAALPGRLGSPNPSQ